MIALPLGLDLFKREAGPLVAHALYHGLFRQVLHRGERVALS